MIEKIIKQEKSNEELERLSNDIIDLLKDCNIAETYKIMHSLYMSLLDIIKKDSIIIQEET